MPDTDQNQRLSRGQQRKARLREVILKRDINGLSAWAKRDRNPLSTLTSMLFDSDPLTRWRAIEAVGLVARDIAADDLDKVRRQVGQYFWMMNDESGNLCWYAAEAIGEIMVNIPRLVMEYGIIISSYLDEEPFEAGVRHAMRRMIESDIVPAAIMTRYRELSVNIVESLTHKKPAVRGQAILALRALKDRTAVESITKMKDDHGTFDYYDFESGQLHSMTVGSAAAMYLGVST